LKYPPFPWAQNFQDGAHQTTGAQRKIFEKGTIFSDTLYLFTDFSISRTITVNNIKDGISKFLKAVNNKTAIFKNLTPYK
jgi:hypothetical protein